MRRTTSQLADFTFAPIMSLASLLIPMLLMGASFVDLAVLDSTLPAICTCGLGADGEQELNLQVFVHEWGVEVSGDDDALFGRVAIDAGEDELRELGVLLGQVKDRHPHSGQVLIAPDPAVEYARLIAVMDAARELDGRKLFGSPVLQSAP